MARRRIRAHAAVGGRYGLSSKEFTPAMVKAVLDELGRRCETAPSLHRRDRRRRHHISLAPDWNTTTISTSSRRRRLPCGVLRPRLRRHGRRQQEQHQDHRRETDLHAQGYFVYDSKKAGRSPSPICASAPTDRSSYLIAQAANFVACHQFDVPRSHSTCWTQSPRPGATFLLNSPLRRPRRYGSSCRARCAGADHRQDISRFMSSMPTRVAREAGIGARINTIMQTCFFHLRASCRATRRWTAHQARDREELRRKGAEIVRRNLQAVDERARLPAPGRGGRAGGVPGRARPRRSPTRAPEFVQRVTAHDDGRTSGDLLPVSQLPVDGTFPTRHQQVGKARHRPGDSGLGSRDLHPVRQVRARLPARGDPRQGLRTEALDRWHAAELQVDRVRRKAELPESGVYTLQVAPEDCTGCGSASRSARPRTKNPRHKAINMEPQVGAARAERRELIASSDDLPEIDRGARQHRRQGLAAPRAAVRVLRRLRRLWRDALHQAA